MGDDKLVSIGEAARQLRVSDDTVRRYFDDGLLSGEVLPSGHRRVSQASITALTEKIRSRPAPSAE